MVIPAIQARNELHKRLVAVFSEDNFTSLCEAKVPNVYLGFPTNEPPFYVAVDEIIDTATTDGSASMGHAKVSFELNVFLCAVHRDLTTAADTLLAYIDVLFSAILADQSLNYSVDNSFPQITTAGTAADSSKRYIAAANVSVTCEIGSVCPARIKEIVNDANSN